MTAPPIQLLVVDPIIARTRDLRKHVARRRMDAGRLVRSRSSQAGAGGKNLTRRANHRHNDIIKKIMKRRAATAEAGYFRIASADTDEGAPDGREAGTYQDNVRIVAECAAIADISTPSDPIS